VPTAPLKGDSVASAVAVATGWRILFPVEVEASAEAVDAMATALNCAADASAALEDSRSHTFTFPFRLRFYPVGNLWVSCGRTCAAARRSLSVLIDASESQTACTQLRATRRPQAWPSSQRSVPSSPV
jgi:hypothetical protein